MDKFLTIVIPSYQEPEGQIYPLLASICTQTGVDLGEIEIIIVKDGGGKIYTQEFLNIFPLDIKELSLRHNYGPGLVREAGISRARGEYLMFCDADDTLHNVTALQSLIQAAKTEKPDILRSKWIEETVVRDTGALRYIPHEGENTWMHGKLIRRQFLIDNSIHFHPELRVHEDTYFLSVAQAHAKKYINVDAVTYFWKFNPQSITRSDDWKYEFASFPTFFRACGLAHNAIENVIPEQMPYKTVQVTCYCYFAMHEAKWLDERVAEYRQQVEKSLVESIGPTWKWFMESKPEFIAKVYNEERAKHGRGLVETETLGAWLARIGLAVPDCLKC